MSKKTSKPTIRELEHALIEYLYRYKVAHAKQIGRDIYPGITHQGLYKRLGVLSRARIIRKSFHQELHGRLLYSLSEKGYGIATSESGLPKLRHELQSASPLHDLDLLEIGQLFRSKGSVIEYWPENYLKSGVISNLEVEAKELALLRPDAVLKIRSGDRAVTLPLEYERTLKFAPRYDTLFRKYYARENVPAVLFIGRDAALIKTIKAHETKFRRGKPGKFLYSVLPTSTAWGEAVTFTNLQNESLTLS